MLLKTCKTCGETKPLDAFKRSKKCRGGRTNMCSACAYQKEKARLLRQPEARKAAREAIRRWHDTHIDVIRACSRATSARRRADPVKREHVREANRRWRDANPDYIAAKNKAYYQNNKTAVRAYSRARYMRTRESALAQAALHYRQNRATIQARVRAYLRNNPEKERARAHSKRGRKRAAGRMTPAVVACVLASEVCFYCERMFDATCRPTIEHLIPLVRGGTNAAWNLVPACRSCNSRKQRRMPAEWEPPIGRTRLNEKLSEHLRLTS
jgi:5-methylcytosine-specific restriction endonuclease McrA